MIVKFDISNKKKPLNESTDAKSLAPIPNALHREKKLVYHDDVKHLNVKPIKNRLVHSKKVCYLDDCKKALNESSSNGPMKGGETTKLPNAQLGDSVMYKKMKGFITGAIGEQVIVSVQNSTYTCDINSKDLKVLGQRNDVVKPPFKFDAETQKVLFEQYIKCGIYMGSVPIKTSDCFVKYSDFRDAKSDDKINIMVEGSLSIMDRSNIKIYEDVNEFANPENYIEGVIIDEANEEAIENVMINVEDYTDGYGDASPVRIIRGKGNTSELDSLPKALLKTLSV